MIMVRTIVEYGHTLEEYDKKFGWEYDMGSLWDYSPEDFIQLEDPHIAQKTIEEDGEDENVCFVYWYINDRYYETSIDNIKVVYENE